MHPYGETAGNPFLVSRRATPQENREYSYTDKKAGFWYGRTHQDEPTDWYAGWNLAKKRIFSDYVLSVDGKPLVRQEAEVTVLPDCLTRRWKNAQEQLQLVDDYELLCIRLSDIQGDSISLMMNETLLKDAVKKADWLLVVRKLIVIRWSLFSGIREMNYWRHVKRG